MPRFKGRTMEVDTDVMYSMGAERSLQEYYVGVAPLFICPSGARETMTIEDCLVYYREDNLMPPREGQRVPKCYRCVEGARVRTEFAEMD